MTAQAISAATLILFSDTPHGPEHLFVERAAAMAFAGGAVVFPGGRVDPGDRVLGALRPDLDPDNAAARVAAIRETIEETGLAIGVIGKLDIASARVALAAGTPFGAVLKETGAMLDLDALTPFAHWCPTPRQEARTFDTRFYIAAAPDPPYVATVDATENVRLFWARAVDVLALAEAGSVRVIFPTRRNLDRLATLGDFADACAHAAATPIECVTPWIETRDGAATLCIPEGLGYPVTAELLESALRG